MPTSRFIQRFGDKITGVLSGFGARHVAAHRFCGGHEGSALAQRDPAEAIRRLGREAHRAIERRFLPSG